MFKCDSPGGRHFVDGGLIFLSRDFKHDWHHVGINYDDDCDDHYDDDDDDDDDDDNDDVALDVY